MHEDTGSELNYGGCSPLPEPAGSALGWLRLCINSAELLREYDRLNGTDLSRRSDPISQMVDDATGKYDQDARGFLEFCMDLYRRLPPNVQTDARGQTND